MTTIQVNGNTINVVLNTSKQDFTDSIKDYFKEYEENFKESHDYLAYPLQSVEATSTMSDIVEERERMIQLVSDIFSNINMLVPYAESLGVKKNGRFRKGAVSYVSVIESATSYFTDFTNAWSTCNIKLKAMDENTVELIWNNETYTY